MTGHTAGLPDETRAPRRRSGISLIEIVVACTLLAMALTALTGLAAKMASRQRNIAYTEQRVATLYQEVNRVQSLMYDSLSKYLVTDSVKSGNVWYVWTYTVDPDSTSATGTSTYRKVRLTVTPRASGVSAQSTVIRRSRSPSSNPLNCPVLPCGA
jgi:Tfp pilus assembly protein PilV